MKYVIKKAGTMAITLFVVCFLIFGAFDIIPGDPALSKLGTQATESSLAALRPSVFCALCRLAPSCRDRRLRNLLQLQYAGIRYDP